MTFPARYGINVACPGWRERWCRARHITLRNAVTSGQRVFFGEDDYAAYIELMAQWCKERGVAIWSYCLMPNHVHLIAVPETPESLRLAVGEVHRRYTRMINFREGWRGHLWQGRFASYVMDDIHLFACARYIDGGCGRGVV